MGYRSQVLPRDRFCLLSQSQLDKLSFLNAVATLSSVVRDQANGNMNNYYPKTLLAKKIEVRQNIPSS